MSTTRGQPAIFACDVGHSPGRAHSARIAAHVARATRLPLTLIPLAIADLLPIFGVFFLGWDPVDFLLLYWMLSAIICFWGYVEIWVTPRAIRDEFIPPVDDHSALILFPLITAIVVAIAFTHHLTGGTGQEAFWSAGMWVPLLIYFVVRGVPVWRTYVDKTKTSKRQLRRRAALLMPSIFLPASVITVALIAAGYLQWTARGVLVIVVLLWLAADLLLEYMSTSLETEGEKTPFTGARRR